MTKHFRSLLAAIVLLTSITSCQNNAQPSSEKDTAATTATEAGNATNNGSAKPALDTAAYNQIMQHLHSGDTTGRWPVKAPLPLPGAILPFNRVIAFYGNLYSTRMGILGELPKKQMFAKLQEEVNNWQKADTTIPVLPALHYIAVTAQDAPGKDGKYRLRMPFHQIDTIMNWAKEINALVFLDIQVGFSTLQQEVPQLEQYLKLPNVHFGIDPEFSMKTGSAPGHVIGSFNADDINYTINYLSDLVKQHNIPPKMLVIHRFTEGMVKNAANIKPTPEVQVIMDMDGWGNKVLKRSTWLRYIYKEPVHFTGFKIFYKNDTKTGADQLYKPEELLQFVPKPIYIQYQ